MKNMRTGRVFAMDVDYVEFSDKEYKENLSEHTGENDNHGSEFSHKDQEKLKDLEFMVTDLDRKLQEMEDRWKRTAAELDNARKRFLKESERIRSAEQDMIFREWLFVVDNMERALAAEKEEENPWYQGIKAVYQQMQDILRNFSVQAIDPKGELFDYHRHEAVATVNKDDVPEGAVAEVVEKGYSINGRTLRTAKVITVSNN
jgi:molecular chaperone GrpE